MPKVTFYTCVYNGAEFIYEAMDSVRRQTCFNKSEYIIVDDYSLDNTPYIASKFAAHYDNVHYQRLNQNIGLASASNEALKRAKGKYIVRLDADDFFSKTNAIDMLIHELEERSLDAIYPGNYYGRYDVVQKGNECHHIGGTLFLTRSINHIKFTDRLRNYEGLDFFGRAKNSLDIGYYNEPLFFYRQSDSSMSRTNLEERARIREDIKNEFGV
jgi:glycosyltransferase involved in cell wall biosynthesis